MSTAEKERRMAEKLLAAADKTLAEVDQAFIIQQRGVVPRLMPTFRPEEISLGSTLGKGGFAVVNEILKFTLDQEIPVMNHDGDTSNGSTPPTTDNSMATDTPKVLKHSIKNIDREESEGFPSETSHVHYDISEARQVMRRRCLKIHNGVTISRYALKRLRGDLTELERARGMVDMAIEAKYLSTVWHPNIVKMRGMAKGNLVDELFFIIMDRLVGTLDQRINEWHAAFAKMNKSICSKLFGMVSSRSALLLQRKAHQKLLIERLTVIYDLAAAFFYLHENRLVYRDIKPENIGFDFRGDVKVFDFGLCKSLAPHLKARDGGYGYRLTGRAGSLPYMSPEVIKMETYDTKCDVYSFAILLWEILNLEQAFKGLSPSDYVERVVIQKERLPIRSHLMPPLTRLMLPEAWDADPRNRPDMKRVAIIIRGDLNDLTEDDAVLHRTRHMDDRSMHSMQQGLKDDDGDLSPRDPHED